MILLALAAQTIKLRVELLDCRRAGCSIRDVVFLHDSKQACAIAQPVVFPLRLHGGGEYAGSQNVTQVRV